MHHDDAQQSESAKATLVRDVMIVLTAMVIFLPLLLLLHRYAGRMGSMFLTLFVVVPLVRTGMKAATGRDIYRIIGVAD